MTELKPAEINQDALRGAEPLVVRYKNWRGEVSTRRILPLAVPRYGTSEWHPEPQWLLLALDVDKGEEREFAMKDMAPVAALPQAGEPVAADGVPNGFQLVPKDPTAAEIKRVNDWLSGAGYKVIVIASSPPPAPSPASVDAVQSAGEVVALAIRATPTHASGPFPGPDGSYTLIPTPPAPDADAARREAVAIPDVEIRKAIVAFMGDMNSDLIPYEDCAKLLAKRLKKLAADTDRKSPCP